MSANSQTARSGTVTGKRGGPAQGTGAGCPQAGHAARPRSRTRCRGSHVIAEHHLAGMGLEIELPFDVVDLV